MTKSFNYDNEELKILRKAVDDATEIVGKKLVQSETIKNIIEILEDFLRKNKILCYGGTAINNILPEQDRFYNKNIEIPDYDFFSPRAKDLAINLANIYYNRGFHEVEAKSGIHSGTYKVYVNFIPIADITYLDKNLFNSIYKTSIKINSINYCPPNFLRMSMFLELSRPMGDVSRWEKVLKRLSLLNKNYPLIGKSCKQEFQREFEGDTENKSKIFNIAKNSFINQGLVFFGSYAFSLYNKYMKSKWNEKEIPDFDVISIEPLTSAKILKEQLIYEGFDNISIIRKKAIGEYTSDHFEVIVDNDVIAFIYKADACHNYNIIKVNGKKIKVASIDTILSFYLVFIYANRPYYDLNRLLCMAEFLFKVQLKNRLQQNGLLKRFSVECFGKQKSMEDIREEKAKIYTKIKSGEIKKNSKLYEMNFFRYIPKDNYVKNNKRNKKTNRLNRFKKRSSKKYRY